MINEHLLDRPALRKPSISRKIISFCNYPTILFEMLIKSKTRRETQPDTFNETQTDRKTDRQTKTIREE